MTSALRMGLALLALLGATGAWAADESQVLRQQAERLASQDRCDEAIERARRARALDPGDARAALVEGRCLLRGGEFEAALEPLRAAREGDPPIPGVSTDLVQAYYHLGRLEEAAAEIERGEAEQPGDARLALYKGLVLARQARNAEAADSFDRAASLDPSLADAASLYAARTYTALRDRERAEEALERARDADPDSEWGREAGRELAALREATGRRAWLRIEGGIEWDDNVALANDATPNRISQDEFGPFARPRDDVRGIWEAESGVEVAGTSEWSTGAGVLYRGNAHVERTDIAGDFDLQAPSGWLWFDKRLGESTWLRLQPFGGFTWLGYEPFVLYGGGAAEVSTRFDEQWGGRVFTQITVNDFQFRPRTDDVAAPANVPFARRARNRDGTQYWVGAEGNHTVAATDSRLRLGSAYERYQAEGRDWRSDAVRAWVGLFQPLPWRSRFEVEGAYTYRPFEHRSTFRPGFFAGGGPKRRDQVWEVETELAHRVTDWLELAVHWRYLDQESNTRVFDFDRHVVGGTFTLFFGRY